MRVSWNIKRNVNPRRWINLVRNSHWIFSMFQLFFISFRMVRNSHGISPMFQLFHFIRTFWTGTNISQCHCSNLARIRLTFTDTHLATLNFTKSQSVHDITREERFFSSLSETLFLHIQQHIFSPFSNKGVFHFFEGRGNFSCADMQYKGSHLMPSVGF